LLELTWAQFFPVIGSLVADRLQGKCIDEDMPDRFSFSRTRELNKQEEFRNVTAKELEMYI
jgi:hypothetical protein